MFVVEAVFKIVQHAAFQVAGGQRGGVYQIIIVPLHRLPDGLEPFQPFIADVPQLVDVLHLINSEAVALVVEERLLPFLLVVHTRLDLGLKSRAFLPFLVGDGKDPVVGVQVSGIKSHRRILSLLDHVHSQVLRHQLVGPLFGKGQKVAVQVAALFQIVLGQRRVRHGIFVQMLFRGVRQLGGFRGGGLGLCLHLLDSRLLQGLDHGQRRILNGLAAHSVHLADFQRGGGQGQLRRIQLAAVQLLPGGGVVERVVPAGVAGLNMKIGGIINQQQGLLGFGAGGRCIRRFLCGLLNSDLRGQLRRGLLLGRCLFRLGGQVNAALLTNFLVVPVNIGNQLTGGLIDNLQAGPQFLQFLALAPTGDIAEAVVGSLDTVILANRIGDALGLDFLSMPVLRCLDLGRVIFLHLQTPLKLILVHKAPVCIGSELFRFRFGCKALGKVPLGSAIADHDHLPGGFGFRPFRVVQLAVGGLMNGSGNGLHLAHAFPDGDALLIRGKIAVHVCIHRLKLDGDRGGSAQGLHKNLIILDIPGKRGRQFRQGLAVRLADVEHLHRAEQRDLDFLFLHDDLAILIQHGGFGVRVQLLLLDFLLIWCRGNDGNAVFTPLHMAGKLIFPLVVTGHQRGVRALHIDEHGVVDRVAVEAGHHGQVTAVFVALEQLLDTLFNARRDFL